MAAAVAAAVAATAVAVAAESLDKSGKIQRHLSSLVSLTSSWCEPAHSFTFKGPSCFSLSLSLGFSGSH